MIKDVAIICQYFYPEYISSATLPTELAIGLREKGLNVGVVTGYPKEYMKGNKGDIKKTENYNGVKVNRVRYTRLNNKTTVGRILNFFTLFLSMLTKLNYLRKFETIIVYSNPPILPIIPYYLNKIFRIKFIFIAYDIYPDSALKLNAIKVNGLIHKVMKFINKRVYKKADKIVLIGNEMKDYVINNKIAIKEENLQVIPNWYSNESLIVQDEVLNDEFKRIRQKYDFIVLYSGNMGTFQDMKTILDGLLHYKDHKDVLFIFCGHGNKLEEVERFINSHRILNAKVFGFLLGTAYADVLKISDICLVSLEKGIEGLGVPSKTYGYFAAGKPIVAIMSSDTDIARNIISKECGRNISQGDINAFINAINFYKNNPDMKKMHSVNARELYISKYTRERCIEKYFEVITG